MSTGSAADIESLPGVRYILLLTCEACRYDFLVATEIPGLSSYRPIGRAQALACFTHASHQALFFSFVPNAVDDIPHYSCFCKQRERLAGEGRVAEDSSKQVASTWNISLGRATMVAKRRATSQ